MPCLPYRSVLTVTINGIWRQGVNQWFALLSISLCTLSSESRGIEAPVLQLVENGRTVVAAARDAGKAAEALNKLGLSEGRQTRGAVLAVEGGVDITERSSFERKDLWLGVTQIAVAVGPLFGRQADGQMG